jgi:hypothetical protein
MQPMIVMRCVVQMVSNLVAAGAATVVFVDGENISQALAGQIMAKTQPFGPAMVSRVYGDVSRLPNWEAAAGFEMIHTGHAKNGADMRICIDALDLVHRGGVGRVVIASSDRDFTHLAQYLRAKGIEVVGMGEAKTHESFRKACSQFIDLGAAVKPAPAAKVPAPAAKGVAPSPVLDITQQQIAALITAEGTAGIPITALSVQMRCKHGFLIGQHDKKNWRGYLSACPAIYDLDPKGPSARVRLK